MIFPIGPLWGAGGSDPRKSPPGGQFARFRGSRTSRTLDFLFFSKPPARAAIRPEKPDLRWRAEQKRAFYTNIGDAGLARETALALRGEMKTDVQLALMAQLQPLPGAMMRLLTEDSAQAPRLGREC